MRRRTEEVLADIAANVRRLRLARKLAEATGYEVRLIQYVEAHNDGGKPFKWIKTADEILEKMRRFGLRTQEAHAR